MDPIDGAILGRYENEEDYAFAQEYEMHERTARMEE